MNQKQIARQRRLTALAENDPSYILWRNCREEFRQAFADYANAQPEEIRNFLWGYAQSAELTQQRLVNLACLHMSFPEEGSPL